jgi:hypothetical protein
MKLIHQRNTSRYWFDCRRFKYPIIIRNMRWLAVLKIGSHSFILAEEA